MEEVQKWKITGAIYLGMLEAIREDILLKYYPRPFKNWKMSLRENGSRKRATKM